MTTTVPLKINCVTESNWLLNDSVVREKREDEVLAESAQILYQRGRERKRN